MSIMEKIKLYIPFREERDVYPETFQEELNYQCSRILTFACLISPSWLPYIPIDMQLHPDQPLIVVLRICFPLVGAVILILSRLKYFKDKSLYLIVAYGSYLMVATGVLTGLTGGDPSYIGGYILILCILAMAPIRRKYAYRILFVSVFSFFALGAAHGLSFDSVHARYSLNDLIVTIAVVSFFIYILDSIRFNNWQKSKKIEQSQKVIIVQRDQLEDQINLAGEIQKQLLPHRIPDVANASVAYNYHPMMGVGGDFVDVHYSADRKGLGLFICDVSGHGVAAAIISSMVKMSLAGWAENLDRPSVMLQNVYGSLNGKISTQFVTASMCYINLETGSLRIASAGHPPVSVIRKNGVVELFQPKGKIINDMMPPDYEEIETQLDKYDKVILYTDGIVETFNTNDEMYGDDRLVDLLVKNRRLSPGKICERIMEDLTGFSGANVFEDDITILVTEYQG